MLAFLAGITILLLAVPARKVVIEVDIPRPPMPLEEIRRQRTKELGLIRDVKFGPAEQRLIARYKKFCEEDAAIRRTPMGAARKLSKNQEALRREAMRYLRSRGHASYRLVGLRLLSQFEQLFWSLMGLKPRPEVLLGRGSPGARTVVRKIRRLSGSFLYHARGSGLLGVSPAGALTVASQKRPYVAVLFKANWAGAAGGRASMKRLLSSLDRRLFLRWRAEEAVAALLRSRIAATHELEKLKPGYPGAYVRAVLYIFARRYGLAYAQLKKAIQADPQNEKLTRLKAGVEQARARRDR